MKALLVAVAVLVALAGAAEDTKKEEPKETIRTFSRLIPADVLRDFPGVCFASTRCATVDPGSTWSLAPFCGRSTCIVTEDALPRLLELVEDCGPLPLPNKNCAIDLEKTNKTAEFPLCCPVFTCEPGAKLEYPDVPSPAGSSSPPPPPESSSAKSAKA